jgi:hypothetical protein
VCASGIQTWEVAKTKKNKLGFGFLNYMGAPYFFSKQTEIVNMYRAAGMIDQLKTCTVQN